MTSTEKRALELVRELRKDNEIISKVTLEGRKIVIEFKDREPIQEIDGIKW